MAKQKAEQRPDPWNDPEWLQALHADAVDAFWRDALCEALDSLDAAAFCARRACRVAGRCRLVVTPDRVECGGVEIREAIRPAAGLIAFGLRMIQEISRARAS